MKHVAVFITILLILMLFAGCTGTKTIKDPYTDSVTVTPAAHAETPVPTSAYAEPPAPSPAQTPSPAPAPTETPAPAPLVFDITNIIMRSTPGSSCFSEIGYDPDFEILVVKFRDSGSVYTYSDFPQSEWDKFTAASSLGSWYNKHIKGKYDYEKLD